MKKVAIKVIKRKDIAQNSGIAANDIKSPASENKKMVTAVNGWIFQHHEKQVSEKVFSDSKILSWEPVPKTLEKKILSDKSG